MRKTHGLSHTPEYAAWRDLKSRCLNPNHIAYPDYGGRGITVYEPWVHDFVAFYEHVGPRPSDDHTLDRLDNDKGYEPGNVAWRTWGVQQNNRRPHRAHGIKEHRPVRHGHITSTTHGMTRTPEYRSWSSMKDRCLNPNSRNFEGWGGRGITVYEPWIKDFAAFYAHVGPRPSLAYTLHRIDNSKGYEPGNVKWADWEEQCSNKRPPTWEGPHPNSTHYMTGKPEYRAWAQIKSRCFNPKFDRYAQYGGKGITMCHGWADDAEGFLKDVGLRPQPDFVLMRIDPTKHFSCGHCTHCEENDWVLNVKWGSQSEANRNRAPSERSGKLNWEKVDQIRALCAEGKLTLKEIAEQFGIGKSLVQKIKANTNWKMEDRPPADRFVVRPDEVTNIKEVASDITDWILAHKARVQG